MSMSPEAMLHAVRDMIAWHEEVRPCDAITRNHEELTADEILDDLKRMERTLYLLVDSRKVLPFSDAPKGFEAMALEARA